MKIFDQHVHSHYSFDSEQSIEEYLSEATKLGLEYFVLTDHYDLNYLDSGKDLAFDLSLRNKEQDALQKKYPNIKILNGIEIGYKPSEMKRIIETIKNNHFDVINFSLHESDKIDYYMEKDFLEHGIDQTLKIYFSREIEMLEAFDDYDVCCHIDYGFKTAYLMDNSLKISDYENMIIKIMKLVIKNKKALEINTKVEEYLPVEHTKYLLNLYKSLGGEMLTLSSDAHQVDRLCSSFPLYTKIIKDCSYKYLTYFIDRKAYKQEI